MNARMKGSRRRGRPRRRWMNDVQEDIASLGVSNWKVMASDSVVEDCCERSQGSFRTVELRRRRIIIKKD